MDSRIYDMRKLDQMYNLKSIDTFILGYQKDERSLYSIDEILSRGIEIKNLVVLNYHSPTNNYEYFESKFKIENIIVINISFDSVKFLERIKKEIVVLNTDSLYLDISCLDVPDFFVIMKLLKAIRASKKFQILYSIPFDYYFNEEPFTSFSSYTGDLETREIVGYSGNSDKISNADLLVFMGFEGALSLKVIEDIDHRELILVNGLPSFYQKYKDISVINNYSIMSQTENRIDFVPADNPFEVYNYINNLAVNFPDLCIAPLSTKLISLGVCLYALENSDVRVIYPVSKYPNPSKTYAVHETLILGVCL